jgi:hypothetical protein
MYDSNEDEEIYRDQQRIFIANRLSISYEVITTHRRAPMHVSGGGGGGGGGGG